MQAFGVCVVISYLAVSHWNLNSTSYAPYPYGLFSWSTQISRLIMMATASALCVALVSRSQRLVQLATSDHLTGLFNRGYVEDRLAMGLSRERGYGKALTGAGSDGGRCKVINDTDS